MEASNGLAFLPLLAILESLGLKISWSLIRVEEMIESTNFGLPLLDFDRILHQNYIRCSSSQPSKLSKRGVARVVEAQLS